MADIMSGLGGLLKGLKPLMEANGSNDCEDMNVLLMQTDVSELKEKKKELFAKIGEAVYLDKSSTDRMRFESSIAEIDMLEKQINQKTEEAKQAQKALEEKKKAEEAAKQLCTCPQCGYENPEGTKFCSECGTKLDALANPKCPQCGAENEKGAKFCGECGTRL